MFDPTYPAIDMKIFNTGGEWKEFYRDAKDAIPLNAIKPQDKVVDRRMMVDSDHAGDKATRRFCTGFMILINIALIQWLSENQPTIESSVFRANLW